MCACICGLVRVCCRACLNAGVGGKRDGLYYCCFLHSCDEALWIAVSFILKVQRNV